MGMFTFLMLESVFNISPSLFYPLLYYYLFIIMEIFIKVLYRLNTSITIIYKCEGSIYVIVNYQRKLIIIVSVKG